MGNRTVSCDIRGISPLLMHSFPLVPIEALEKKSPQEQAEFAAYRNGDKKLYVPAEALQRAFVGGSAYSKGKGRASLSKVVAACLFVSPEHMILNEQHYIVDGRPVVVPATKGRVMRYRPRLNEWSFSCEINFDPDMLTENQMRRVVDDTGSKVGLLDFRPEKRGSFGRFMVTRWELNGG